MIKQFSFYLLISTFLASCVSPIVSQDFCNNLSNGAYPHPTSCTQFFVCDNGRTHVYQCPVGLLFDQVVRTCTEPQNARCYTTTTSLPVTTLSPEYCRLNGHVNGIYPHPVFCNEYILCSNGNTQVQSCPIGLVFSTTVNACIDGNCNNQGATVIPAFQGLDTVCEMYHLAGGIYPDPANCDYFVECLDGVTHIMQCPDGLRFNVVSKSCDHHGNVNCNNNYGYTFS